jgi:hypothetical protein
VAKGWLEEELEDESELEEERGFELAELPELAPREESAEEARELPVEEAASVSLPQPAKQRPRAISQIKKDFFIIIPFPPSRF